MTSEQLLENLSQPAKLETLFRNNPQEFERVFNESWPQITGNPVAQVWRERLRKDFAPVEEEQLQWGKRADLWFVLALAAVSGFLLLLPEYFPALNPYAEMDEYVARNVALFTLPFLALWFWRKQELSLRTGLSILAAILIYAVYINVLPTGGADNDFGDTFFLALLHGALFLWALTGFVFSGVTFSNEINRIPYLRFNGELVIMGSVLSSAWAGVFLITMGLFNLIGINLRDFHSERILIHGIVAIPLVGAFVIHSNPQLVNRVSPLVARIFSPVVLFILTVYLVAMMLMGKDPYSDREFLIIFNVLLLGVVALILFSVSGLAGYQQSKFNRVVLLALAVVTIVINVIALSAIIYRIGSWGITPNRMAVLGSNGLILVNLMMITLRLYGSHRDGTDGKSVEDAISRYLPVYAAWAAFVTFFFPLIFGFS